jgi:hypothetical protein
MTLVVFLALLEQRTVLVGHRLNVLDQMQQGISILGHIATLPPTMAKGKRADRQTPAGLSAPTGRGWHT